LFDRSGWKRVRFGDVVRQLKEQVDPEADGIERYVAGEHMETQNVHIRKWGTVGDGYLGPAFIRGFRKGQVLYGSRRTYLKKVAVAEWDGVTANTTFVLEAVEGKLLQELLPWLMLSDRFTKHSVAESKGSTNPYINFPDIAKFEFDLPPLDQQRRIAEILWAVDEARKRTDRAAHDCSVLYNAKLREIFLKPGSDKDEVFLEDICDIQCGYAFKSTDYQEHGIPLIRISNVSDPYIDLSENVVYLDDGFLDERPDFIVNRGDVLVALSGATTGKTGTYNSDAPALLNQRVGRLRYRPDSPVSQGLFNQAFFLFRERILRDAYGAAQPNISPKDLRRYSIFVPRTTSEHVLMEKIGSMRKARETLGRHSETAANIFHRLTAAALNHEV
jgi:type I restriction enzyme S subunit